ncbi:hypothetical protein BDV30DRAFT_236707 [Aspergillus minisclerotigenes]|uniref:Uncharacterized protein n=1 Tax=Aspergillus minisclerotigenes TaxID=656917 RepID=A0A5N6JAN2_9EURO|nr:hypothetical protein BDV30DRAFT_236707 [Aspergillus minisclerotigenes]
MQKTAEIANWFATTVGAGLRKLLGHRLLASQNSNECTITLAKPGMKYGDYLTNPTSYGNGKETYVKMQEYGPFDMTITDDVRAFAMVHLAFTLVFQ